MNETEKRLIEEYALLHNMDVGAAVSTFQCLKETVINIWEKIKEILENIDETISETEKENYLRATWYVPMKIVRSHQVMNRKPLVAHIRNHI